MPIMSFTCYRSFRLLNYGTVQCGLNGAHRCHSDAHSDALGGSGSQKSLEECIRREGDVLGCLVLQRGRRESRCLRLFAHFSSSLQRRQQDEFLDFDHQHASGVASMHTNSPFSRNELPLKSL
jgi:hypothetical protein